MIIFSSAMPESDSFWDLYWDVRLQAMEDLGKREAILGVSRLIRAMDEKQARLVRLLELGCGEGQIIGALAEGHARSISAAGSVGVDYRAELLEKARRDFPGLRFVEGDFTDPILLAGLGQFEIVLLVNALHEVFSAGYSAELGEVDVVAARRRVAEVFARAAGRVAPGGSLALFDGLEPPGDPEEKLRVRFQHPQARLAFEVFAREYRPFRIAYRELGDASRVEISRRDFTRYITKSIFLGKKLWQTERLESYQYFTEAEFIHLFARQNLSLLELRTLTVDGEKWRDLVEIETPGVDFPEEHIWILGQKRGDEIIW